MNIVGVEALNCVDYNTINSDLNDLAKRIKSELDGIGYLIVRNFPCDVNDVTSSGATFLALSEKIGVPMGHDKAGKIIWDIKKSIRSGSVKTFSEHDGEAKLHTDSQYSEHPEDYFGLLTLKDASCGGGLSLLITVEDLLNEVRAMENGANIIATLEKEKFPFIVPSVFRKTDSEGPEFAYGPILNGNEIRFRDDTIRQALPYHSDMLSQDAISAFEVISDRVTNSKNISRFYLKPNDLIFLNNKTTLHGRTAFSDVERHLLRIRLAKFD